MSDQQQRAAHMMDAATPPELESRARDAAEYAVRRHAECRGKIQIAPKCDIRGFDDFAVWYTPGVAAACRAIQSDPARELALCGEQRGLSDDAILPRMDDIEVAARIAAATAMQAQADGVASRNATRDDYLREATHRIVQARVGLNL
jgi:malic enzyme